MFARRTEPVPYASHVAPIGRNEDRVAVSRARLGALCCSVFSVFDGHLGSDAASFCAGHFNARLLERLRVLARDQTTYLRVDGVAAGDVDEDFHRLALDSLRLTVEEMDLNVRARCEAGTTLNSLLVVSDARSGIAHLYCANVGDSRSVLFARPASSEGKPALGQTLDSFSLSALAPGSVLSLSEDHKLSLGRERARICSAHKTRAPRQSLPRHIGASGEAAEEEQEVSAREYPSDVRVALIENGDVLEGMCENKYRIVREDSCIGKRRNRFGVEAGPDVLFGRFDVSINMTRSVGDKYGPRSCIAAPEVTYLAVDSRSSARVVIASDGLWDVVSVERARQFVFSDAKVDAVAVRLCAAAVEARRERKVRADDVGVIVVEICPRLRGAGGQVACCLVC